MTTPNVEPQRNAPPPPLPRRSFLSGKVLDPAQPSLRQRIVRAFGSRQPS